MARRQRSVDVFEITSEFCHGNVSYAAPTLSDAVWFTAGENGDYVVSDDAMATYEYALRLDPKYTPFPPPLRIGIICELSPVDNGLTSDGGLAGVPVDASALVKSRGNFVDYENGEDTQFKHSWMHLMSLAGSILPMSVDPSVATGMFRVLELQEPALCLPITPGSVDCGWDIRDWPVASKHSKRILSDFVDTHRMKPLPAIDNNGVEVNPADYRRALEGAVLWVEFEMYHRESVEGRHEFEGVIQAVNVIHNPLGPRLTV